MATLRMLILLVSLFLTFHACAENTIIVKHYQQQARYEFGLKVLDFALSKLDESYQIIGPEKQEVNEARGELQVMHRPELAKQIERGMPLAIADGSYKALFLEYHEQDSCAPSLRIEP